MLVISRHLSICKPYANHKINTTKFVKVSVTRCLQSQERHEKMGGDHATHRRLLRPIGLWDLSGTFQDLIYDIGFHSGFCTGITIDGERHRSKVNDPPGAQYAPRNC